MTRSYRICDTPTRAAFAPEARDVPAELARPVEQAGLRPDFWNEPPAALRKQLQTASLTPSAEAAQHRLGPVSAWFALLYSRLGPGQGYGDLAHRYVAAVPVLGMNAIKTIRDLREPSVPQFFDGRPAPAGPGGADSPSPAEEVPAEGRPAQGGVFQVGTHLTMENLLRTEEAFDLSIFDQVATNEDVVLPDGVPVDHAPVWLSVAELISAGRFPVASAANTVADNALPAPHLRLFISHRWRGRAEPDPDRRDFELVYRELAGAAIVAVVLAARRGLHVPRRVVPGMNNATIGLSADVLAEAIVVNVLRGLLREPEVGPAAGEAVEACRAIQALGGIARADLGAVADVLRDKAYLRRIFEHVFLWYDYSCAPQGDRDGYARAELNGILRNLRHYVAGSQCVFILDDAAEFYSRAWCAFEAIAAAAGPEPAVLGAARAPHPFGGRGFDAYPSHLRELVKRAVLDTEVFGAQDRRACMDRLGLAATDERDVDYLYGELTRLALDPLPFIYDDTEIVTGCYPVLSDRERGRWIYPGKLWTADVQVTVFGKGSINLTEAMTPRPVGRGSGLRPYWEYPYWEYRAGEDEAGLVGHVIVVAGCEPEAVLWSDAIDRRVGELEELIGAPVRSRCWLATDFAPVGCLPHGALETRPLTGRAWVVVTSSPRLARCPLVWTVLQAPAFLGRDVYLVALDGAEGNFFGCRTGLNPDALEQFPVQERRAFQPVRHEGGLFRNVLPDFL